MCKAIRVHTTGSADMSLMDKMLFIADGTGDDRKWEDVPYVRELSEKKFRCSRFIYVRFKYKRYNR